MIKLEINKPFSDNRPIDGFAIYKVVSTQKKPFWLDSGMDPDRLGRYSFMGMDPFTFIQAKNGWITVDDQGVLLNIQGDPFEILKQNLAKYPAFKNHNQGELPFGDDLPFNGGAVGYLGYDLRHHVERLSKQAVDDISVPDLMMGLYDGCIAIDHLENRIFVVDANVRPGAEQRLQTLKSLVEKAFEQIAQNAENAQNGTSEKTDCINKKIDEEPTWRSNFEKSDYIQALSKVRDYIRSGDIYQMNMTQRFEVDFTQEPMAFYERLRTINPAPFAAYLDYGDFQIASCSPERFLKISDRQVETRPIKGTRPRGITAEMDEENRKELECSEKDRSELLMIVDLERNDLGRVAKTGSVKVPELFEIETYPTVFHLVSTVTAELDDDYSTMDCIKLAFPGGSITGAPKIRAMEIIDELEPTSRNIYTGSIGYIDFNGDADLNIVIRTLLIKDGKAWFQTGGGIVWDSVEEQEYEETFHKARALMSALGINTDFISNRL